MPRSLIEIGRDLTTLFSDPRVKVALVAFVLSVLTLLGVPENKKREAVEVIITGNALAGVLIAGMSFVQGKEKEGTVPEGHRSLYDPAERQMRSVDAGQLDPRLVEELIRELRASRPAPPPPEPPSTPVPGGGELSLHARKPAGAVTTTPLAGLFLLCAAVIGAGPGCANSKPFTLATSQVGPDYANVVARNVRRDTALGEQEKLDRLVVVERFKRATTADPVEHDEVVASWADLRALWEAYDAANPYGLEPDELALRRRNREAFDKLLDAEGARPLRSFLVEKAPPAVAAPAPAAPAPAPADVGVPPEPPTPPPGD